MLNDHITFRESKDDTKEFERLCEEYQKLSGTVYRIAHAAVSACSGCGKDSKWLDEIEDLEQVLKNFKILDTEKILPS